MTELFPRHRATGRDLRALLEEPEVLVVPGCHDALSARLVEAAGHRAAFCGGFSVAATRLGLPDVGLLSYGEMVGQVGSVVAATALPVIADADTGYGNAVNVQRSVLGFARAGAACVMIEDQEWPKQCGHTAGKSVVGRAEAIARVQAATDIRDDADLDVLIMARTDAAAALDFDEAIDRACAFVEAGADLILVEAPETVEQMGRICTEVPGLTVANLVEDGRTPWLEPDELTDLGFAVAIYPVSMLLSSTHAMQRTAHALRTGQVGVERAGFDELRRAVGWSDYDARVDLYEREER